MDGISIFRKENFFCHIFFLIEYSLTKKPSESEPINPFFMKSEKIKKFSIFFSKIENLIKLPKKSRNDWSFERWVFSRFLLKREKNFFLTFEFERQIKSIWNFLFFEVPQKSKSKKKKWEVSSKTLLKKIRKLYHNKKILTKTLIFLNNIFLKFYLKFQQESGEKIRENIFLEKLWFKSRTENFIIVGDSFC